MKLSRPYYLCKSDRVVVLFLLAVLAVGVIGYHLLWPSADTTPIAAADSTLSKRRAVGTDSRRPYTYATPSRQVVYAPFDPNTADSTQLLSLGLQPYQVRSIYHYRAKGGVYRRPSDFARLYGLTAKQYRELEPYIRISADYLPASEVYAVHDERPKASSDSLRYPVKLRNSERVALNLADTTLLRRVPGIGAYYARRIVTPEGTQVLRVGEDVANIWGLSADTLPLLCGAVVVILLATAVLAWWLTRRLVQPINHLAENLDTIEADVPYEELIPLARTIQTDRKLREDNETMRREFTANVSHELKTPLTSISGYAELIETGMAKPADVPTFAARIHKEAQRMIALVSDILQLSELDSTQASQSREKPVEMVPVDLAALIKETAQNMTVNARKAYVTLQYNAQPATVQGSKDLLTELATNLCDNAIRYNQPGGHVELRCGTGPDGPWLQVEDNGIGIPQDSQARVFERFYRVDKSRSKATGGTGLGLAIVKHIALLHHARIDLQSQVGSGTTIKVSFPKA